MPVPGIRPLKKMLYRSPTTFVLVIAVSVSVLTALLTFEATTLILKSALRDILQTSSVENGSLETVLRNHLPFILLVSAVPPIVGALFLTYAFRKKVAGSIKKLRRESTGIARFEEIDIENLRKTDLGFEDLNLLRDNIISAVDRIKSVDASRKMLELELKLTQSLVIPSTTVRDWCETVKDIVNRLSEVVQLYCLYACFSETSDRLEVHIFWNCERDDSIQDLIEEEISRCCADKSLFIQHHEVNASSKPGASILLQETIKDPSVGGIVCCGLVLKNDADRNTLKVIESFLPALMSVVGSAKALDRYARDIEFYATRDPLTGLYNQRVFWELLEYEIERAKRRRYPFAVLLIDIDNFKVINDTYGHNFGDAFLKELAKVIRETFRREDIVARYGGDEFAVILPHTSQEEALKIARRLLERLERFSVPAPDGKPIRATVSIGISLFPNHGESARDLFVVADNIMYKAKNEGKNRVLMPTEEDIKRGMDEEGKMGILILESAEKDLIKPVYQPIVKTSDGSLFAYEVLMRLKRDGSLVKASQFIHLAEKMGIVHKLDLKLIEKALQEAVSKGFKGKLFFNLSPKVLVLEDFLEDVRKLVDSIGVDPDSIVFELTERDTVRNVDTLKSFVEALKKEGFHFAVDDFGSGFSSFLYLKHLPVDFVKIEGEFVRSILQSKMDRAFVISMIALAETLGIQTIAEFVESKEVFEVVKTLGVNYAQGYYIGKPSEEIKV